MEIPQQTAIMQVGGACGIVMNTLLIPLIAFGSSREIGSYKLLLMSYAAVTVVFSILNTFAIPSFSTGPKGWSMYTQTQYSNLSIGSRYLVIYCICYIEILLILMFSFMYRYMIVIKPNVLNNMGRCSFVLKTFLMWATGTGVWTFALCFFVQPSPEKEFVLAGMLERSVNRSMDKISYIGLLSYTDVGMDYTFISIAAIRAVILSTFFSVTSYCTVHIIMTYNSQLKLVSERTRQLQFKLFMLLLGQTAIPLCFTYAPCLISIILAFTRFESPEFSRFYSTFLCVAGVVDPLLLFIFVSEYRTLPCKMMGCLRSRFTVQSSGSAGQY